MNETSGEDDSSVQSQRIKSTASVLKAFIKWGALTGIAYFGLKSIQALAGKVTFADIAVTGDLGFEIGLGDLFWIFASLASCVWALAERSLRRELQSENE